MDTPRLGSTVGKGRGTGRSVLIHIGDPVAFFEPLDDSNERLDELRRTPKWSLCGTEFPRMEDL